MGRAPKRKRSTSNAHAHKVASTKADLKPSVDHPPLGGSQGTPTADTADLSPATFWDRWVLRRQPVVLTGHPTDATWKATQLWTNEYLSKTAGDAKVAVEQRTQAKEGFGKGRKVDTTFGQFLKAADPNLYLTTQQVGVDADGHPALCGPPVSSLQQDLPLRPSLMGHLVPQQLNLWMGHTSEGASSGLHHDFHDNLYILLRGSKRFRLFSPQQAQRMYTHGKLQKVYPNGRIVYAGSGAVLADGSDAQDVEAWQRLKAAEAALTEAEKAVQRGDKGSQRRLAQAEARLEAALDTALDEFEGLDDDFSDSADELSDEGGSGPAGHSNSKRARAAATANGKQEGEPPSFSRIDLALPDAQLRAKFPLFPGKAAALECEVRAGQMLYLPAGWFHEVTSFGGSQGGHLAFNYWFHPPDNLKPEGFWKPYTTDFWPDLWAARMRGRQSKGWRDTADNVVSQRSDQGLQGGGEEQACGPNADSATALQQEEGEEPLRPLPADAGAQHGQHGSPQHEQQDSPQHSAGVRSREAEYHNSPLFFGFGRRQHLQQFVGHRPSPAPAARKRM